MSTGGVSAAGQEPARHHDEVLPAAAPPELRLSDTDRAAAIVRLREATGEGRLTLDEFSDRMELALAARTESELVPVFSDLPAAESATETNSSPATPRSRTKIVAVMSGATRKGPWRVAPELTAVAFWGGVHLDLRDAILEGPVVDIVAWVLMGGVDVIVPEGVPVEVDGFVLMGGLDNHTRPVSWSEGAPLVRVHGRGMWGGVSVRSRPPREQRSSPPSPPLPPVATPSALVPPVTPSHPAPLPESGTVSILVTDIVGSTAWSERLGDQVWIGVLRSHNALVREQVARHGGTEVKQVGDGFVVTFTSAREAVRCARAVRLAIEGYQVGHPDIPLEVRIGVHAGEVERDGSDVHGVNVSTTAHLTDVATPGEVLVSDVVWSLVDSCSDLSFGEGREVAIAGRSRPMTVHPLA